MNKRKLTIGEEIQLANRRAIIKAWVFDVGIVLLCFVSGGALGFYLGHSVFKP
jgi:hypothetical protein